MKTSILLVLFLLFNRAEAVSTGKISCQFPGNIVIQGILSGKGLQVTQAGIFPLTKLDKNPILGESWKSAAGRPWSANGVIEFEMTINNAGEHGAPSQDLILPKNLKPGQNPALLQVSLSNSNIKLYDGFCVYAR